MPADDLRSSPLVKHLVEDPANPPQTLLVFAWIGASSRPKHTRLYLSADLRVFADVPKRAVLHSVEVSAELSPLGGAWLWLEAEEALAASLQYV